MLTYFNQMKQNLKAYINANPRAWDYFVAIYEAEVNETTIKFDWLWRLFWASPQKQHAQQARQKLRKYLPEVVMTEYKKNTRAYSGTAPNGGSYETTNIITYLDADLTADQAEELAFHLATTSKRTDILRGYKLFRRELFKLASADIELKELFMKERKSEDNLRRYLGDLALQAGIYHLTTEVDWNGRRLDAVWAPCQHQTIFEFKAVKVTQGLLDKQLAKAYPPGKLIIVAPEFAEGLTKLIDCELWTLQDYYRWCCEKRFSKPKTNQHSNVDFNDTWEQIVRIWC